MKTGKVFLSILLILVGLSTFSQVSVIPQGFSYQAIARDTLGSPKANQNVIMRFTITNQTGTSIPYIETQTKLTDQFGLFTCVIGQGIQTGGTGTFSQVDWKAYNYYIKVEIQEGTNYYVIGTEPLLTVPYAMVAKEAEYAVPVGTIIAYVGNTPPSGWLLCDGTNYDKTLYPDLYDLIGITYGGVLGANFNVPDYRGMFLRGSGTNNTKTDAAGNNFDGGAIGTYQEDKLQGHKHRLTLNRMYGSTVASNAGWSSDNNVYATTTSNDSDIALHNDGTNGTPRVGGETKPASYSVNYIIKY